MSLFDFNWREHSGEPMMVGETTIVPQSKALQIRLPYGGFVWNRPYKLIVRQDGEVSELPIVDETWRAMLMIAAMGVLVTAVVAGMTILFKAK